jgi:acyl dehydratase
MLHGEQSITLHKPLPVEATVSSVVSIAAIWDKVKAAVVEVETVATDTADGLPMFTTRSKLFFRGEGGWGGDPGPKATLTMPDRVADEVVHAQTRTDQALLYRLNGDRNPLHSDPTFAATAGFDKPILHGLCTYGITGRLLLHAVCDGDPTRFGGMDARFSSPVMPGERLDVSIWRDGDRTLFRTSVGDRTVIDNGILHHE